jgi:hypothetical protein
MVTSAHLRMRSFSSRHAELACCLACKDVSPKKRDSQSNLAQSLCGTNARLACADGLTANLGVPAAYLEVS